MILIILPNQLFPIKLIKKKIKFITQIVLIEEPRYFTDFKFHKLKLVYHRATMKKYYDDIKKLYKCVYIEFYDVSNSIYNKLNNDKTYYFNPIDHKLSNKFDKLLSKANMIENFNFLIFPKEVYENKNIFYKNNKYYHSEFYKFQRRRLNILMDGDEPVKNKWSFDEDNRKKLPKNIKIPKLQKINKGKCYVEAVKYINTHFKNNYGDVDNFIYPYDTKTSIKWLKHFMVNKLHKFGEFQDAVDKDNNFLFHSAISPMMNVGLLPDFIVVDLVNKYYLKHKTIPISSYEGFIRQVIGWRSYVYSIYLLEPNMHNKNYLGHTKKIGDEYWKGEVGIEPIDNIINNIVSYSYAHHIERLMYLGNWFLLNEKHPKEVYRIFMEWTIDAYDWVMVPNVFGMSQYADGGKMMSRMYFTSSNYIENMSNYKQNSDWSKIWNALYYNFINNNKDILKKNYATARQVTHWKNKTEKDKKLLLDIAKKNL